MPNSKHGTGTIRATSAQEGGPRCPHPKKCLPGLCFPGPPTSLTSALTVLSAFLPDLLLACRHHPRLSFWFPHLHTASSTQFRIYLRVPQASLPVSHPNLNMPNTFRTSPGACPTFASNSTHSLENQHCYPTEGIPNSLECCQDPLVWL